MPLYPPRPKGQIRNSASQLAPHVDIRAWNGQCVLPAENNKYWWDPHLDLSLPMVPAPAWFDYRPPRSQPEPHPGRAGDRFDPAMVLEEACHRIRTAREGTRHDVYRHETFRVARLVGRELLDYRKARMDLAAEVMALGQTADGHIGRVRKYFEDAWAEGLAAGSTRR